MIFLASICKKSRETLHAGQDVFLARGGGSPYGGKPSQEINPCVQGGANDLQETGFGGRR